ncbi:hypothetical protein QQF64_024731 [Cirrhinus molitorella]|uniref:Uncharacterized protein n=1 Tax=Cirrhinus molitorella TaxID=172907 RepID=A0ABR3NM44_9TELE
MGEMEGKSAREGVNETERRKKRLDRLPCQTTVDLDVSGMEIGLVMYTIWAKESGTDGILRPGSRRREERPSFPSSIDITKHHL